jgi:hypothetical protein
MLCHELYEIERHPQETNYELFSQLRDRTVRNQAIFIHLLNPSQSVTDAPDTSQSNGTYGGESQVYRDFIVSQTTLNP